MFVQVFYRSLSYCVMASVFNGRLLVDGFWRSRCLARHSCTWRHEAASSLWSYILMRISHKAWEDHTVSPRQLTQLSHTDIGSHDQLSHPILDNKLDKPAATVLTHRTRCLIWTTVSVDNWTPHNSTNTQLYKHTLTDVVNTSWECHGNIQHPWTAVHSFSTLKVTITTDRLE